MLLKRKGVARDQYRHDRVCIEDRLDTSKKAENRKSDDVRLVGVVDIESKVGR